MRFEPVRLDAGERALQREVLEFLDEWQPAGSYLPGLGMAAAHDPEFSRELGRRGWLGMMLPREYGGQECTAIQRFMVTEALLVRGAPIGAHWIADRQTAPAILRHGTEEQRRRFLPAIARGECYFSIGMSEPDSGSDLASIRTVAQKIPGGWQLNGTKVWTSMAHNNQWAVVLCRTGRGEDKRAGLSQFLLELGSPGVQIHPVLFTDGGHHFNEIHLEDVFVPDELVLGEIGSGWSQVTGELAYERSGPDRYLSTYTLLDQVLRAQATSGIASAAGRDALGRLSARLWGLRQMSLSIARSLDDGFAPATEAALVKDLGTIFEREVIDLLRPILEIEPDPISGTILERLLAESIVSAPTFTIRGGTTEVMRSIVSREVLADV